jgi:hypothetical protein
MMPTAISTTFPFIAKSLNSFIMLIAPSFHKYGFQPAGCAARATTFSTACRS